MTVGRRPLTPGQSRVAKTMSLTRQQADTLAALGGSYWLRKVLDLPQSELRKLIKGPLK